MKYVICYLVHLMSVVLFDGVCTSSITYAEWQNLIITIIALSPRSQHEATG